MNQQRINVSLVIPAYNDEKTIIKQVLICEKILKKRCNKFEIIIGDDKSKDKTWELINKRFKNRNNFRIYQNKKNLGITKNILQLYRRGKLDFIFLYSADGDWNPYDVGHLIERQMTDKADIVIGKRKKKIGYTFYRQFISWMHRLLPIIFFGIDMIDPGGIKLVKRELVRIHLISKSQFFEAEIIIRAKQSGKKVSYYPVVYKKPRTGSGYGGAFKSAFESFIDLLRFRIQTL